MLNVNKTERREIAMDQTACALARMEALWGRAAALTVDRWDETSEAILTAMGITYALAVAYPTSAPVDVTGVEDKSLGECIAAAVELARGIDWEQLGASHGGLVTGLRVVIGDLSRALGASALQG